MKTIEARAVISAADKTGGVFAAIAAKIQRMQQAAKSANAASASAARNAAAMEKGTAGRVGRASTAVAAASNRAFAPGLAALGTGLAVQSAIKKNAEAELAVTRIGITADASTEQVNGLQQSIRNLAFESGKGFNEVTSGLESLVAGGQALPEAMKALPSIAKTAQAAGAEMKDMSDTALALNQSLGIAPEKMQSAFDVMVTGGKAGKFELKDMARYFASLAPQAKALGLDGEKGLKRMVALLQTIRAGSGTSEEAATSFQDVMAKMNTEETSNKFKKFGIDIRKELDNSRKSGKDLFDTLTENVDKATKGDMSKLPLLFGDQQAQRGIRAMMTFRDLLKDVSRQLESSSGSTMTDLPKVLQTSQIAINRLAESYDRLKAASGAALDRMGSSKVMTNVAGDLETALDKGWGAAWDRFSDRFKKNNVDSIGDAINNRNITALQETVDREEKRERERETSISDRGRGVPMLGPVDERLRQNEKLKRARLELFQAKQKAAAKAMETPEFQMNDRDRAEAAAIRRQGSFSARSDPGYNARTPQAAAPEAAKAPAQDFSALAAGLDAIAAKIEGSKDQGPVTAELHGEAKVEGQTKVEVTVTASSQLLQVVDGLKSTEARLTGMLRANGPGSKGTSSPDARPSSGIGSR